jgi:hypothetical protein
MLKMKQLMQMVAILVGVASVSPLAPSEAAPPGGGGGGVPPGKIFYTWNTAPLSSGWGVEYLGFWSMNADGSGKQLLTYQPANYDSAQLSYLTHEGHRWFLESGRSPNSANRSAMFAVRDDGDPNFTVVLVDAPDDVSMNHWRWAKDDSFLSIAAMPVIANPNGGYSTDPNALHRIYAAGIAFDPDSGLPALTTPLVEVVEGERLGYPDIENHDWSPDGTEVVYGRRPNDGTATAEVKITNVVTGETRLLANNSYDPVWSPDGTRVAYKPFNDGIHVVNPDGSGLLKITSGNGDDTPGWSPDSKHVVFERILLKTVKGGSQEYHTDIYRVPAGGGKAVNLTGDIEGWARARYWR